MSITLYNLILAGAALAATVLAAGSFRLPTLVRAYAVTGLSLGLLIAGLAVDRRQPELFWLAAVSIALKALIIPWIVLRTAERAGMSMRLSSSLKPASTYLAVLALVAAVTAVTLRSPFAAGADPEYLLIVGVAMFIVGFSMMIMRRDLLSQVMGFLALENGIAVFSFAVVRDLPFLVELGVLMTLTIGIVLMGAVSGRVRELYGTESTHEMRELID